MYIRDLPIGEVVLMVSSCMGCWASLDIGRVVGFGCDGVGLNICEFDVYAILG